MEGLLELTLQQIARTIGGEVIGDASTSIMGINALDSAQPGQISFYHNARYQKHLAQTKASALIVSQVVEGFKGPQIITSDPQVAFAKVVALFAPPLTRFSGVSPQAFIHETARIAERVTIYPLVYISEGAQIGDQAVLFPGVFIGERVRIGERTVIHANVSILRDCIIGNDVIIYAGTVIGSDGFGFVREKSVNLKIPQIGIVQIDDQVEIGANCCIDRAALGKTWIKRGVKTDNLVQIAHNVVIGEDSIIVAQVGISGSVQIGREVVIAGQAGLADHVTIGDRVMIGGRAAVTKSLSSGQAVTGMPAMPYRQWLRTWGLIGRLPDYTERLKNLEKKVMDLEQKLIDKE
jgi:UDP-3-O-[3-hydroxymyristoyl] glucosamine N-acyltransferase